MDFHTICDHVFLVLPLEFAQGTPKKQSNIFPINSSSHGFSIEQPQIRLLCKPKQLPSGNLFQFAIENGSF